LIVEEEEVHARSVLRPHVRHIASPVALSPVSKKTNSGAASERLISSQCFEMMARDRITPDFIKGSWGISHVG
jgi:hypothetical protein